MFSSYIIAYGHVNLKMHVFCMEFGVSAVDGFSLIQAPLIQVLNHQRDCFSVIWKPGVINNQEMGSSSALGEFQPRRSIFY